MTRLTMGIKLACAELNTVIRLLLAHIRYTHLIHDHLAVAAKNDGEHASIIE